MNIIKNKFKVVGAVVSVCILSACASGGDSSSQLGKCPQPRFTDKAPTQIYNLKNPVVASIANFEAGEDLYNESAAQVACISCHGESGNGLGAMSSMFDPPPRNFSCAKTVNGVPHDQLFWIIKNGSPGTSMPPFNKLSDEQIWQLVHYIRKLANDQS